MDPWIPQYLTACYCNVVARYLLHLINSSPASISRSRGRCNQVNPIKFPNRASPPMDISQRARNLLCNFTLQVATKPTSSFLSIILNVNRPPPSKSSAVQPWSAGAPYLFSVNITPNIVLKLKNSFRIHGQDPSSWPIWVVIRYFSERLRL